MKTLKLPAGLLIVFCALIITPVFSQGGDQSLQVFPETTPQLYNELLTGVPDIQVETVVGHLPRLPSYLAGVYKNNIEGPDVRVLWPAPADNSQVLTPGTYTIAGRVAGTDVLPKSGCYS